MADLSQSCYICGDRKNHGGVPHSVAVQEPESVEEMNDDEPEELNDPVAEEILAKATASPTVMGPVKRPFGRLGFGRR